MLNKKRDIELRSEEVQDILSQMPNWIIRWGNLLIFIVIILLFILSWVIKYPDIITAQITITTHVPPEKIIAKSTGRIEKILVNNRQLVTKDTPLAIIENTANYQDVFFLKNILDTISTGNKLFKFPLEKVSDLNFGPVENAYSIFEKEYLVYTQYKKLSPHNPEMIAQNIEAIKQEERLNILKIQKEIGKNELFYKKQELERYQKLFNKGVISAQEWEQKNVEFLQQEKIFSSFDSQISQIQSSINELNRNKKVTSLSQTRDDATLVRNVILSLHQLKKAVTEWKMNYVLQSHTDGEVYFMQLWAENQNINSGEETFVIIPKKQPNYIGKIKSPALNSGKIKLGQSVSIRLTNYPDREFGILKGNIQTISPTPDKEGNLLLDVSLPNDLETSFHKKIDFKYEMTGTADIITEDLRLIERLLHQFRDMFKQNN